MAKELNSPVHSAVAPRPRRARRRIVLGVASAFVLGAAGAFTWHLWHRGDVVLKQLPPIPDLSGKPEDLRQAIDAAERQVLASRGAAADIAALGRLYHVNGFVRRARTCWTILSDLQPAEPRWRYYLADLNRLAADHDGFQRRLTETVARDDTYAPAWLDLADLEFKSGDLDQAEQAYERRLELTPHDPYAGIGLARIALARGARAEAKRRLLATIRDAPRFSSAHNLYAEILAQENDRQGAADQRWLGTVAGRFRAAPDPWLDELRPCCFDADQLIVWGEIDAQTKTGDHGESYLARAVRVAPRNAHACEKLGSLYLDSGDPAKAIAVLERGSRLPGASELLCARLCDAYRALSRPADALRVADQSLTSMPDSAILENARGLALDAAGRFAGAIDAFRAAMARAPSSPDAVANLGVTLLHLGRPAEATIQLNQALALQPAFPNALIALARIELQAGDAEAAARHILPYFQQFPGLATARDLMSNLYLARALAFVRSDDAAAVERTCREGLELVPESAELYGFLGSHYEHEQRWPEALAAYESSRKLRADDPRILLSLGELYHRLGRDKDALRLLTEGEALVQEAGNRDATARFEKAIARLPQ